MYREGASKVERRLVRGASRRVRVRVMVQKDILNAVASFLAYPVQHHRTLSIQSLNSGPLNVLNFHP